MTLLYDAFAYPWVLLGILVLVPIVWLAWRDKKHTATLRFSNVSAFHAQHPSWAVKARIIVPILRSLAVILLVIAIARPHKADELTRIKTEGVALQLVVDRSGSMAQDDFVDTGGQRKARLQAVKDVVHQFVLGNERKKMAGRLDDLVGLIVFARYPDTECPMTRDHEHLVEALDKVDVPRVREEDGTAIGDALLLAVERIRNIGRRYQGSDDFKIKSRAIILLTDGEQNAGKYKPEDAAEAAKALDIKVYTIGAAPRFQEQRLGGVVFGRQAVPIDERSLNKVAEMTGGKYFRATDADSLEAIYAEIDKLERSNVDEQRYYLYEELAYKWIDIGPVRLPPPLLAALLLLTLEVLLVNTRLRRIP